MYIFGVDVPITEFLAVFTAFLGFCLVLIAIELRRLTRLTGELSRVEELVDETQRLEKRVERFVVRENERMEKLEGIISAVPKAEKKITPKKVTKLPSTSLTLDQKHFTADILRAVNFRAGRSGDPEKVGAHMIPLPGVYGVIAKMSQQIKDAVNDKTPAKVDYLKLSHIGIEEKYVKDALSIYFQSLDYYKKIGENLSKVETARALSESIAQIYITELEILAVKQTLNVASDRYNRDFVEQLNGLIKDEDPLAITLLDLQKCAILAGNMSSTPVAENAEKEFDKLLEQLKDVISTNY